MSIGITHFREIVLTIGNRISELRIKAGLSQNRLAILAGINQNYISRLESGKRQDISLTVARKLARAFNISLNELACGVDE
jgi:transcriptional regulator with XRE-family HTH domain